MGRERWSKGRWVEAPASKTLIARGKQKTFGSVHERVASVAGWVRHASR